MTEVILRLETVTSENKPAEVRGTLKRAGTGAAIVPFEGWLQLLSLLEAVSAGSTPSLSADSSRRHGPGAHGR